MFVCVCFESCDILLDVVFTDLKKVLNGLMTRDAWYIKHTHVHLHYVYTLSVCVCVCVLLGSASL